MSDDTPAARRWRALVAEYAASGLTNDAFAARHDLNPRTLAWWRSQLKRSHGSSPRPAVVPQFAEVVVSRGGGVVLTLDDFAARLVIDDDTDLALVRRVLEAIA